MFMSINKNQHIVFYAYIRNTLPSKKLKQPEKDNLFSKEILNQNDAIDKKKFSSNKRPIQSFSSWQGHLTLPIFLPSDEKRFQTHNGHRFCKFKDNRIIMIMQFRI